MSTVQTIREHARSLGASFIYVIFGSSVAEAEYGAKPDDLIGPAMAHMATVGSVIVNGGYMGTMASSAAAVRKAGGSAIGVPCANLSDTVSSDCFDALVPASCHWDRLKSLVEIGDAFVVLPGGVGTATEVAALLWNTDRRFTRHRPILFLGDHWEKWLSETLNHTVSLRDPATRDAIHIANTPDEVETFFNDIRKTA